jgi:hypothetical protein
VPALAFNPVCPFGYRTLAAAGTPQLLFTTAEVPVGAAGVWPVRVSRIYLEVANANTGFIYIGLKGMVVATGVNVIASIPPPNGGQVTNWFDFDQIAFGANNYRPQDFWMDGSHTGDKILRTVWVA